MFQFGVDFDTFHTGTTDRDNGILNSGEKLKETTAQMSRQT